MEYTDAKDVTMIKKWVKIPVESINENIPLNFEHCLVSPIVYEYIQLMENIIGIENLPKCKTID